MSNQVNANVLKNFIVDTLGINKISKYEAKNYDINASEFEKADVIDENNYIDLEEILDDPDLYDKFATMYVEERDNKANEKDAEREKEEEMKVKDKNDAGI